MHRRIGLVAVFLAWSSLAAAETTVRIGVGTPSLQFDFLYSDYGVERTCIEQDVAVIGEPDLLVALHLARIAAVEVEVLVGWRRDGMSWDAITRRCGRDGRIYYIALPPEASRPPYGRALGHWRKHPRGDLELTDAEVRELVLVRELSRHCRMPEEDVVRARLHGQNPRAIATRTTQSKEDTAPRTPGGHDKGRGKRHGKSK